MQEPSYICPKCGAIISLVDVNEAKDIGLCRTCTTISKFSELEELNSDEELIKNSPLPNGLKVEKTKKGLRITFKEPWKPAPPQVLEALFWNGIIIFFLIYITYLTKTKELLNPQSLPFLYILLSWVSVFWNLLALRPVFGKSVISLSPGQGELFIGIGTKGRRWTFTLSKRSTIKLYQSGTTYNIMKKKLLYRIAISQPTEEYFTFNAMILDESTLRYICAILRQFRA